MDKIDWVILDVDGVLLGEKQGFNYPHPHRKVIEALKAVRESGVQVTLCTGKPAYSLNKIVQDAGLSGPHIADNGGIVADLIGNKTVEKTAIAKSLAQDVLKAFLSAGVYVEAHDGANYYIQKSGFDPKVVEKRTQIMLKEPTVVDSLLSKAHDVELTKIIAFANDEADRPRVERAFSEFADTLSFRWNFVPITNPAQYEIITAKGVSKEYAAGRVSELVGRSFDNAMGVGDGLLDWGFMQKCHYVCAMGNAIPKLKELIKTKGEGCYYVAPPVDEHGVIDAFRHFGILK